MSKSIANLKIARPTKARTDVAAAARAFVGDTNDLVRLSVDVPPALRRGLKQRAAADDRPVRELVISALYAQYPDLAPSE